MKASPTQEQLGFELCGVERSYPRLLGLARTPVLRGIDLRLERSSVLGLVGPNGSGKTTLLRLLAGVDSANGGQIRVLGNDPRSTAARRALGWLPADSPFPPELSGKSALELMGSLNGLSRAECKQRVPAMLERVGLLEASKKALRQYSRGMLRRFGLAQACLHKPEVLLFDEPTAGLDAQGFGVFAALLEEARARGAMIVLCSHALEDVTEHATHLAVMVDGQLALQGGAASLMENAGRTQLECENLNPADLDALQAWVKDRGARVVRSSPGRSTLLELYERASS